MKDSQRKAMFASMKGSLPSNKIHADNARPDNFINLKEPEKQIMQKDMFDDGTHFRTLQGHIAPASHPTFPSGYMKSTGFKHPSRVPNTLRGFEPSTEEFDVGTDQYGNVYSTRQGTPTYNGGDVSDAEHSDLGSSFKHSGEQFIDQGLGKQDRSSRSPTGNPNEKFYDEDWQEKENLKKHNEQIAKWKSKSRTCSNCHGKGKAFNFSDSVKASTGRVGKRTGYGTCVVCNGSGKN